MSTYEEHLNNQPEGFRVWQESKAEIRQRKIAITRTVFEASMAERPLHQETDISMLPECIDLVQLKNGDWLIPPSPWQAMRSLEWLKSHAPKDTVVLVVQRAGFDTMKEIEDEIARFIDDAQKNGFLDKDGKVTERFIVRFALAG